MKNLLFDLTIIVTNFYIRNTLNFFSSTDIEKEFRRGRLASLMGVEGGHAIASSMGVIRALYDLGVRYMTLTHKCHTPW